MDSAITRRPAGSERLRIGVISDTHVPEAGPDLPAAAYEAFAGTDLILHGGDLHHIDVLDRLERIAPVVAARGNGDPLRWLHPLRPGVPEDPRVEETHILELLGWQIGMTHDLETIVGQPDAFAERWTTRVFGRQVDIAICGHTHIPLTWGLSSGTAILNPGSPTLSHGYTGVPGTVGILELSATSFRFEVIDLGTGGTQLQFEGPGAAPMREGSRPVSGR